jgi:8-oxo-dGTP pyrophosphatase MutT (NUDIX family)
MPRAPAIAADEPSLLEAIAGNLDGATSELCVRRETIEEAGIRLKDLDPVSVIWPMPAMSTERLHLYLAAYTPSDREGAGGGCAAEGELITVEEWRLADLATMVRAGTLSDAKLLILVQALMLRRPELFA